MRHHLFHCVEFRIKYAMFTIDHTLKPWIKGSIIIKIV